MQLDNHVCKAVRFDVLQIQGNGPVTPSERERDVALLGSYYFQFTRHTRRKPFEQKSEKHRFRVHVRFYLVWLYHKAVLSRDTKVLKLLLLTSCLMNNE